jgi:mRNA interferase RelE/StbE
VSEAAVAPTIALRYSFVVWRLVRECEAAKALDRTPTNVQRLVLRKLRDLVADPSARNNNVKKLVGRAGFRLRVGEWRIIFELRAAELIVLGIKFGPRSSIHE